MSNTNKNYPTHKVWFSDNQAQPDSNNGIAAGVVWPRKNKQGGLLKWNISPEILGDGAWRLLPARSTENSPLPPYTISFSQSLGKAGKLGRAVKVARSDEKGLIHWTISPEKLVEGVLFLLIDKAPKVQSAALERPVSRFNTDAPS